MPGVFIETASVYGTIYRICGINQRCFNIYFYFTKRSVYLNRN